MKDIPEIIKDIKGIIVFNRKRTETVSAACINSTNDIEEYLDNLERDILIDELKTLNAKEIK